MVLASRILGVAIRWPCLSTSLTSPAVLGKQRCPSVQWLYRRAGMEVQLVSLHKIISLQLPLSSFPLCLGDAHQQFLQLRSGEA